MTARFHIGDLLSITDGRLLSPTHMDGVYRIVDHVTGQKHMTHQLPRAAETVRPWLLEQHPWLTDLHPPADADEADLIAWLSWAGEQHGEFHEVEPMPFGMYVGREALAEAEEMAPRRVFHLDPTASPASSRVQVDLSAIASEVARMAEAFRKVGVSLRISVPALSRPRSYGPPRLAIDGHAYRRRIRARRR